MSATPWFSSAPTRRASSPGSCCTLMAAPRRWSRSSRWASRASNSESEVVAWDSEDLNVRVYGDAAVRTIRARFADRLLLEADRGSAAHAHVVNLDGRWQLVVCHA